MIDHFFGRPSSKSRRLQVLGVLSFWSFYLYNGQKHGPPGVRSLSTLFTKRLTAFQIVAVTMMYLYAARNFSALVGLASPEPMANMYDSTYFRATWVLTALDAGFWTAMKIKVKWLRDIASLVFSVFYLFAAEMAEEKVRKVRGMITVEHMRVAWNKGTTPYLRFFQTLMRPRFTRWPPRQVRIPRPAESDYKEAVVAWLYYDGPLADLKTHSKLILDMPGGGFVAMDPRCNDDRLFAWAAKGIPILSLDYRKAPEFPYPYALNECFDVYATLIKTKGRCIGMAGGTTPKVIITGDSAGGNLAVATTLMILETNTTEFRRGYKKTDLPSPEGLVCFYPALDMNIGNWMTDEQMSLIRDRKTRKTNKAIVRRKSREYSARAGTPHHSEDSDEGSSVPKAKSPEMSHPEFAHAGPSTLNSAPQTSSKRSNSISHHVEPMKTRIATSSMISYFNDRVLSPEMMRAMIILYVGPHNRPNFSQDYMLCPVLAPDLLLAKFPKTYFMTGERDPLVDDTLIFAGRLRRAKEATNHTDDEPFSPLNRGDQRQNRSSRDNPEVILLPGVSHGFMQFPSIYPPAWKHFDRCTGWFNELFRHAETARSEARERSNGTDLRDDGHQDSAARRGSVMGESSGDDERPLEIGMKMTRARSTTAGANRDKEGSKKMSNSPDKSASASSEHDTKESNGRATSGTHGDKKSRKAIGKNKSLVRLNSTDDLLGRRMMGLTNGLTGNGEDDD